MRREQSDREACRKEGSGEPRNPASAAGEAARRDGAVHPGQSAAEEIEGWVRAAQGGDRAAFERLVEHFQDRVWRRARRWFRNEPDEVEDLAQEVFAQCFRKLHQFRGEAQFWTWLSRIVDNLAKNRIGWLKRRASDRTWSLDAPRETDEGKDLGWDPPDNSADPRRRAENREAMDALNEKLNLLSDDRREILLLRFADGLSYEEIAATLGITLGTVKSRISRAREELRGLMPEHLQD